MAKPTGLEVVDADGHVAESAEFFAELFQRFPDHMAVRTDTRLGVLVDGRAVPFYDGPGAGCPPDHGITTAAGVNPHSVDGVLADADADGIDLMVLFPSFGLHVPAIEDPALAEGIARSYNRWVSELCAKGRGR